MAKYLTTREVADYLRLNEKKVYALVAEGQLPAARISGKWLFPQHLVDQWLEHNTVYPTTGLMGAVLDDMMVVQGSDDWLFSRAADHFQSARSTPVVSAQVGSLAGLSALGAGKAHLAGFHVENDQVDKLAAGSQGCYLVHLFRRQQGLIFDRTIHPEITSLRSVVESGLRFADRQPLSGTYRLAQRLFDELEIPVEQLVRVGPFSSHLELALAVQRREVDAGMGTRLAAEQCGLDFIDLCTERYRLAFPIPYASHPRMAGFLEFILEELATTSGRGVSGYAFEELGRMETIGGRNDLLKEPQVNRLAMGTAESPRI